MNAWLPMTDDLRELGRGEAAHPDQDGLVRRLKTVVRYADHTAWVVATAMTRALAAWPAMPRPDPAHIGVVVSCAHAPRQTLAEVAQSARAGFASPLRYPAANPGSLVGVACIALNLHGPTLNLLAPPVRGVPLALCLSRRWLLRGAAGQVLVAVCDGREPGAEVGRALLLGPRAAVGEGPALSPADIAWLSGSGGC
jgi:hypothetical protein